MTIQPVITFNNIDHSSFIEKDITEKTEKLVRRHPEIMRCRVVVGAPHHSKHKGALYEVRINLEVPGQDVSVNRVSAENHAHEDMYVAIRDAFSSAERILDNQIGKMHDRRTRGPGLKDLS